MENPNWCTECLYTFWRKKHFKPLIRFNPPIHRMDTYTHTHTSIRIFVHQLWQRSSLCFIHADKQCSCPCVCMHVSVRLNMPASWLQTEAHRLQIHSPFGFSYIKYNTFSFAVSFIQYPFFGLKHSFRLSLLVLL